MTSHVQLPEPTAEIVAVQDDLVTLSPLGSALSSRTRWFILSPMVPNVMESRGNT